MCCSILLVLKVEISCAAGHAKEIYSWSCKGIYSNGKNVARILDQGFVCFWALKKEKVTTSMCTLK